MDHQRQQGDGRRPAPALGGLLLLLMLLPAAPAQASEVVKLTRLVISGKRIAEPAAEPKRIQQLPPVLIEGRRSEEDGRAVHLAAQRRGLPKAL